jgi:hypothetical protein
MPPSRLIGLGALALGVVLLIFAWRGSNAPVDEVTNALSGRYTNHTMWYLIGGVVAAVVGAGLFLTGNRRS